MPADAWEWAVEYEDGLRVTEQEAGAWGSVIHSRVRAVELQPRRGGQPVRVEVVAGARPVCYRRRRVEVNLMGGPPKPRQTLTVAGWESEAGSAYVIATDDGKVTVRSRI